MKFADLQNKLLSDTLSKLFTQEMPVKAAYKLSKIQKTIGAEAEKYQEMWKGIIDKYAVKTEDGEVVTDESGNFKIKEGQIEKFVKDANDLHDIKFDVATLAIEDLVGISLTANELSALSYAEILAD